MQQKIYYWINNPRACHGGVSLPENEQISCGTSFSLYALLLTRGHLTNKAMVSCMCLRYTGHPLYAWSIPRSTPRRCDLQGCTCR